MIATSEAQAQVPQTKTLGFEVEQLRAFLITLIEHQQADQQKISEIRIQLKGLEQEIQNVRQIVQSQPNAVEQDEEQQMGTQRSRTQSIEAPKASTGEKKSPIANWVRSDAELDDKLTIKINAEFKAELDAMATELGVTLSSLIRQFIIAGCPALKDSVGPINRRPTKA